jgi:hypothetical protein
MACALIPICAEDSNTMKMINLVAMYGILH